MVVDCTVTLTLKVEERVMRDVHMGSLVCLGNIVHLELIVWGKRICHDNLEVAWHTVLSVWRKVRKNNGILSNVVHIPYHHIKSLETAVESLTVIVLREVVCFFTDCISTLCNTVCVWSYNSSEETLARIIDVVLNVVVTKYDILILAILVRSPESNYTAAEISDLHHEITSLQCVK